MLILFDLLRNNFYFGWDIVFSFTFVQTAKFTSNTLYIISVLSNIHFL